MRTDKQIASHRMKYAHGDGGPRCKICGAPTDSIFLKCERCQEALFQTEELKHTADWLREHPNTKIEVAADKKKVLHLVMFRFMALAWCGKTLSQNREKRVRVEAGKFPPGCCPQCLMVYEGMAL